MLNREPVKAGTNHGLLFLFFSSSFFFFSLQKYTHTNFKTHKNVA